MTIELANAYLAQVIRVPKRFYCKFGTPTIDTDGNAVVVIVTRATTISIALWFKQAGLTVTRFGTDSPKDTSRKTVVFRELPIEGQGEA